MIEELVKKMQEGEGYAVSGVILSNERKAYYIYLPDLEVPANFEEVHATIEDWQTLLKELDDRHVAIDDPDKNVKILVRKSQRAIEDRLRWKVFKRDSYACVYCNTGGIPLTIDHYFPQEKGGKSTEENMKTSCRPCNKKKGNMLPEEWEAYRLQ